MTNRTEPVGLAKAIQLLAFFTLFPWICSGAAAPVVPSPPAVAAKGYVLQDFYSGQILAEKNSEDRMEPASLTKLMTAYVVFGDLKAGRLTLDTEVPISEKAWRSPGSRTFVEVGKTVPAKTLLMGMIIQSGNDATIALAESLAGSEDVFATLMNSQAQKLGMAHSHFVNSTGLPDPNHYVTAQDLAILARALIRDFPEYYKWYSQKEYSYNGITQYNRNKLLWRDESVDGIKTGHTESAGFCLVSSAKRDNMRLISVILGTKSENARAQETQSLLNFGFRFYETHQLYGANQPLTNVRIWKGNSKELPMGLAEALFITIPRGTYEKLNAAVNVPNTILAPTQAGQKIGTVNITLDGEPLVERPLVALQGIEEGSLVNRMIDEIMLKFK